ncbi:MAG: metalloregulator ArsR/SmtB family transcription factor [Pseudomonadota bacterium]
MNADLQSSFRALADPTRRDILVRLSEREMTIGEVVECFDITRAAVKKHLTVLEEGRLISVQTRGRTRLNRLEPMGLRRVADWVGYFSQFWDQRLASLETAIEAEKGHSDE